MNRVAVQAEEVPLPSWENRLHAYSLRVLDCLHRDGWDLSVLLCNNAYIRSLNARFRNNDEATDVLSFTLGAAIPDDKTGKSRYLPGDVVISLEFLAENSEYFHVSQDEELRRLLIHGILHLDGYDHKTNDQTEPMLQLQERLLAELAGEHILL
ncbi:MAG: rRNA maturation RNase YbeY [Spirochaetaceae bacterium]|jgi:probable rRNA maturation factor|nr:rRNA maturation RNase YbeY [Spirochaetaceae bacterium]